MLGQLSSTEELPSLNWDGSPGGEDGVVAPTAALSRKSGGGGGGSEVEVALPGVAAGLPLPFFAAPLTVSASIGNVSSWRRQELTCRLENIWATSWEACVLLLALFNFRHSSFERLCGWERVRSVLRQTWFLTTLGGG